ncbi:MAG: radical SAM protein [Bacteroidales bacterium]|nr:radical SAM protein [Bacteroidales bacterium]
MAFFIFAWMKKRILPIFIPEAGCSRSCVYCNQFIITGRQVSIDFEQIKFFVNSVLSVHIKEPLEVAFYGGSFSGLPFETQEKLLKIIKPFIEEGKVISIRLSTRPDLINKDKLDFLSNFYIKHIELGVQSTDDDVLKLSGRLYNRDDVFHSAQLIKSFGFLLGLQIMIGLPGDNDEKTRQTAFDVSALQPDGVRIYPTLVLKNTSLENWYKRGIYEPLTLDRAIEQCCWLYDFFRSQHIKIYKMGIHPGMQLEKNLVAGPFHPNFHQLVMTEYYYRNITSYLKLDLENIIYSSPSLIPSIVGFERKNIKRWIHSRFKCKVLPDYSIANESEWYVCYH